MGGNLPPRPGFLTTAPKLLGIFWTLPRIFLNIYWLQNPLKFFPYLLLSPKFWWEAKGTPDGENWFQAYLWLGMPQMEKSYGYIHVFMCSQASGSSGNFSRRHMQTGSRNPPRPEVVMTRPREGISTWSQRLRHTFGARPIHFNLCRHRRHRQTMENTIWYKPEVESVPQTGSTNNLTTETNIDAISVAIPMFWGQVFHCCICRLSPTLPSPRNPKMADVYRK